jgi:hypothetical protein
VFFLSYNPTDLIWGIEILFEIRAVSDGLLYGKRYKKEYACCQSCARTSALLPYMRQTEKERGESHEWALKFMLPA